jgi:hypothetical protein
MNGQRKEISKKKTFGVCLFRNTKGMYFSQFCRLSISRRVSTFGHFLNYLLNSGSQLFEQFSKVGIRF